MLKECIYRYSWKGEKLQLKFWEAPKHYLKTLVFTCGRRPAGLLVIPAVVVVGGGRTFKSMKKGGSLFKLKS